MTKLPIFIKARVCTRIDNETICTTREKRIVLAMVDDTKGTLLDGREVVKVENWWYFIPPTGAILQPVDDSPPWVPPRPPQPPESTPEPKPVESKPKPASVEKPVEKPKEKTKWFRM